MSVSLESLMPDVGPEARGNSAALQLLSFLIIGGLAALSFVALSNVLLHVFDGYPRWIVSAGCYALFIVPVYLAHRRFSFRSDVRHARALPRYVGVQLSGLALASLFSFIAYGALGMPSVPASLLVIGLTSGVNFIVLRVWAFAAPGIGASGAVERLGVKAMLNAAHDAAVFGRRVRVLSERLAAAMPEGGSVLDLGCGDGSVAAALMARRPDLQVEGVDVMIRPTTRIPVTRFDGVTLPFADRSFDYVTIVDVLHHTDDPAGVLAEAARVARRAVVVKDHLLAGTLAGPTLRFMDWVGNFGHNVVLPYNYLPRGAWDEAIGGAGLSVASWTERLLLYPVLASWLFDRHLHFIARLTPAHTGSR